MPRALITDGHQRSTLAVVRSLAAHGIEVVVGEGSLPNLSACSKSCAKSITYCSVEKDPNRFVEDIETELKRQPYDMLLPMIDSTSRVVVEHLDRLTQYTSIPVPDPKQYLRAIDKGEVVRCCEKLDIPVPETIMSDDPEELLANASRLDYPIVIKPRQSQTLTATGWISAGVEYAHDADQLRDKINNWPSALPLPLLQRRVKGPGTGAFLLFGNGEPKAVFCHRRLREKPPSGGVSVLREAIPVHPRMKEYSVKLLKELNWHGPAMVEFKLDAEHDLLPRVIEINARFWGSLQLGIDAGVDFPWLVFRLAQGEKLEPVLDYRTGVKTRWLLGDFDHLLLRMFKSRQALSLPDAAPGRIKVLLEFLNFWKADTQFEIFKTSDLGPFKHELKDWFRQLTGRKND